MLLTPTKPTPRDTSKFPTTQLFLLALVRVSEPIALTSIIPYAWQLVRQFHVGNDNNASFYAGLLISAFALAETMTAMYWGGLSDKLGRKPVIIMGSLGTIASLLILGFSTNIWMALFARFLGGALNGNMGVIQTIVSELVTNPKHEPKAFAVMPFVWSIGTVLGPFLGGFFASPAQNFPTIFSSTGLFAKFPYLLPNLICAGLMAFSTLAGYFLLEETHPDKRTSAGEQKCEDVAYTQDYLTEYSILTTQAPDTVPVISLVDESYGTFNVSTDYDLEKQWLLEHDDTNKPVNTSSGTQPKVFTKRIIMLTVALGIFTYHSMTFDNLMPIFFQDNRMPANNQQMLDTGSTAPSNHNRSFAGGLGMSVKDVGLIMSLDGIIALIIQITIFPLLTTWLGVWKTFMLVTILHPIAYFIMPFLAFLPPHWLYPGIYLSLTIRNLFAIITYPVLLILIKEASPDPSCRGRINGLAASTGAACRTIASPAAGLLYGISMKIEFNALVWWVSAFVAVVGAVQAFAIARPPPTIRQDHVSVVAPCTLLAAELDDDCRFIAKDSVVVSIRLLEGDDDDESDGEDERTPLLRTHA